MKLDMCVDETHNCRAHITEETASQQNMHLETSTTYETL